MLRSFAVPYLLLTLTLLTGRLAAQDRDRPNIIFILTDDQRYDALGYAGNELAHTPEMDRLAAAGTYFSRAMVTTPICAASRATILSGVYERSHRFNFSSDAVQEAYMRQAYPRALRQGGYRMGFYGKYGINYPDVAELFDEYELYDRNNAYPDRRGYYYQTLDGDTVHLTRYTGQQGLDFISRHARDARPFCLQLSFSAPHAHDAAPEQYFWEADNDAVLADRDVPPPALGEDPYFAALPQAVREGFNRVRWGWRYATPENYQHSVKGYFRMLAGIDREIGALRQRLAEEGIADNTVIVLLGDNGYFLGERQLAGKWLMYDNSVRVPLIIYDPRPGRAHHDSDVLALNVDVPATLLDLAGVAAPDYYQGVSLLPVVTGETSEIGRDTALIEHLWEFGAIPPSEGIRTRDWKYFRYVNDKASEELYHLAEDPAETRNLAADPHYRAKVEELRAATDRLIARFSDSLGAPPAGLTVEYLREPAGIPLHDATPELGWQLPSTVAFQRAYQILVSDTPDALANNRGDVWDSGRVAGRQSLGVPYAGPALASGKAYYWKVRIWDEENRLTPYAEPQEFAGPAAGATDYLTTPNHLRVDRVAPVTVTRGTYGTRFDFGRDAFATLELTYSARRNGELAVRVGEMLRDGRIDPDPGGSIRFQEVRLPVRRGTHTYRLPLAPDERNTGPGAVVMPDTVPVLIPYRYAEVQDRRGGEVVEATQLAYHGYWQEDASSFTSSDSILNQVWELCKYTIKATSFAGLYVDGDRERIPYEADAYLNQLSHYTTDQEYAIGRRTIEYFMEHPTWPTEWQLHVALMFWADYEYTGSTELIERYYDDLKWKTLVGLIGPDHLVSSERVTPEYLRKLGFGDRDEQLRDIVDWPPANWGGSATPGERDGFVFRPNNTVINALFCRNMEIMAEFAGVLGKPAERAEFQNHALRAKQAINEKLLDRDRGIYVDGEGTDHASVHANMFPLAFGLVPAEYVASVGRYVKSRGMAASVYGAQYLMEALYRAGLQDYARGLLTDTTDRSWYNMIRYGSTMTMEAWDVKYKPNLDLNHAWGAVPANIIPRYLWGIRPAEPGYGVATIQPRLGDLNHTSITVPTLRGPITARYERINPGLQVYEFTLPGNMVAEFHLPLSEREGYFVDGRAVHPSFSTVRLEPGRHRVEVRRRPQ